MSYKPDNFGGESSMKYYLAPDSAPYSAPYSKI